MANRVISGMYQLTSWMAHFVPIMVDSQGTFTMPQVQEEIVCNKRRLYDACNIMMGLGVLQKMGRHTGTYRWVCPHQAKKAIERDVRCNGVAFENTPTRRNAMKQWARYVAQWMFVRTVSTKAAHPKYLRACPSECFSCIFKVMYALGMIEPLGKTDRHNRHRQWRWKTNATIVPRPPALPVPLLTV